MKLFIVIACALLASAVVAEPSPKIEGRITNGKGAAVDQFPYQVGLSLSRGALSTIWCGGSLIGQNWVLTAAHCTDGVQSVTVYLGSTVRTSPQVSYTVSSSAIRQHTGYVASTLRNDISLINIPSVTYTNSIKAIRLPSISSSYSTYAGNIVLATGWGQTSDTSPITSNLNYSRLEVISNTACADYYNAAWVTPNTICVATPRGTSTCQGDSGGPLALETTGVLVGVTSFVPSVGCVTGFPSGFVRVTSYLDWIKTNTGISY